jgi:hypothetical protein
MGSIAMDGQGNMALGYSASNASVFPSVFYTGRLAGSPLGTMPLGENSIKNGTGSQTGGGNRWGDYAAISVDPTDDLTFWFVSEYVPTTSSQGWRLRIGAFQVLPVPTTPTPTPIPTPTPTPTPTPIPTPTPTPTPIPTPTPTPTVSISGVVLYCSNPVPGPVPNVALTLTGSASGSTVSDGSGNYTLSAPTGGSYTVTPTKAAQTPGANNIDTVDVVATQRHFLNLGTPLAGCRLMAADVNGDTVIDTVDVIAIQRFFLGLSTGIANVGKYQFTPVSRSYVGLVTDQTGQNYNTLVFGDVASGFVERVDGPFQTAVDGGMHLAKPLSSNRPVF